jgi:hypothetical protein
MDSISNLNNLGIYTRLPLFLIGVLFLKLNLSLIENRRNTYDKEEQENIFNNGANKKVNAFITLLYLTNKVKFKISRSRTSNDFIDHLRNVKGYMKNNRVKFK